MEVKLWLDDVRPPPDDEWVWAKTVREAKEWLTSTEHVVTHASLDNDLGQYQPEGRRLVLWMSEQNIWPTENVRVHSANPVATSYMGGMILRYAPPMLKREYNSIFPTPFRRVLSDETTPE